MQQSLNDRPVENATLQTTTSIQQQIAQTEDRQLTYDALVLDAELRQSLATARSLGRRGLRVAALGTSRGAPTLQSRYCQQAFVCPAEEGTEAYFQYLEQLLDRISAGVLIASSDATITLIRRHREQIARRVRIALADEPALAIAVSKERTLEIARRLEIPIPYAVRLAAVSDVGAALREIGLPAVVKPVESWPGDRQQSEKLLPRLVTTREEAECAVEELTRFGRTTLFQQFIPGRRESISLLYAHGQIYACYAQWHKRTQVPLGGSSALRQSIAVPRDIGDQAERLVREIGLEGCSEVEFRRDNAGKPYLMEINPRLWASAELAVCSGVDFPYLLYQWASGGQIDAVQSYHEGDWLRYLRGDITITAASFKQRSTLGVSTPLRAIGDFCLSFFLPSAYDYVDWRDPLPFCKATVGCFRTWLQRAGRALQRKAR